MEDEGERDWVFVPEVASILVLCGVEVWKFDF